MLNLSNANKTKTKQDTVYYDYQVTVSNAEAG